MRAISGVYFAGCVSLDRVMSIASSRRGLLHNNYVCSALRNAMVVSGILSERPFLCCLDGFFC